MATCEQQHHTKIEGNSMSTTEAPFSFTTKVSGDLLTVRGETVDQFADRLAELSADPRIIDALSELQSLGTHTAAVAAVNVAMPGSTVVETTAVAAPAPAGGAPEMVTDKYGAVFTYGHPEAPALPDGRGMYVFKEWRDRSGKARKAFVDPVKGPKPAAAGAAEAPIIWK
jgi:hypothetical protein